MCIFDKSIYLSINKLKSIITTVSKLIKCLSSPDLLRCPNLCTAGGGTVAGSGHGVPQGVT